MKNITAPIINILRSLKYTIKASVKTGKIVLVYFDGSDWVHKWGHSKYLFHPKPSKTPIKDTFCNHDLFIHKYVPKDGDTIVDIGAGVGTEVGLFSTLVGKDGRVVSIEPDPVSFRCLTKTINSLVHQNVIAINAGISNEVGVSLLAQVDVGSISNNIMNSKSGIPINTITLDEIIEKYNITNISYLKMNIEGAEIMALDGFKKHWNIVNNWCVSCHDFLGPNFETYEYVRKWLLERGLKLSSFKNPNQHHPWEKYYIFASIA